MSIPSQLAFNWEAVATSRAGPGPRSRHCLAHDSREKTTILFGGIIWEGEGQLRSDTWELKHGKWSRVRCSDRPPERHRGAMVYDNAREWCVLFGGQRGDGRLLCDTWTYRPGRWERRPHRWFVRWPSRRCGHAMAFDERQRVVVLFGGVGNSSRPLGDTWVFDGRSWRLVTGPGPEPRRYAAFAYDPDLEGCVLHGGAEDDAGAHKFGDTWLFRDGRWESLGGAFDTEPRDDHGMGYHHGAQRMVMLDDVAGTRGMLVRESDGWRPAAVEPLHPRHQCSPLVWDLGFGGLVLHGGEACHGGPQFDQTMVLRINQP